MTSEAAVDPNVAELRVAARTPPAELAAAISHAIYDGKKVVLRAIGAGAVNQSVKAIVIAQGYVAQRGLRIVTMPGFLTVTMDGEERTAVIFNVFPL